MRLAPQAALVLAAAEAQVAAQADGLGDLRHVLAADQLSADAGQLALMPLRMKQKQRLGHHQSQHGVAQKLQALIVAGSRGVPLAVGGEALAEVRSCAACSLARERCVSARTSSSGRAKRCPSAASNSARTASTCSSIRLPDYAVPGVAVRTGVSSPETLLSHYWTIARSFGG